MISKEDLEKFSDISEKIEQELRRIVPVLDDVYGGNTFKLSEKKEVRFGDISVNSEGCIDCRMYSHYTADNLNIPYRIELKYLAMPNDKFACLAEKPKKLKRSLNYLIGHSRIEEKGKMHRYKF